MYTLGQGSLFPTWAGYPVHLGWTALSLGGKATTTSSTGSKLALRLPTNSMIGEQFAGKGNQPHGVDRGGEPANVWRDQMRSIQTLWHPDMVPWQILFVGLESPSTAAPFHTWACHTWAGHPYALSFPEVLE